jgi:hypothetical protein
MSRFFCQSETVIARKLSMVLHVRWNNWPSAFDVEESVEAIPARRARAAAMETNNLIRYGCLAAVRRVAGVSW